MKNLFLFFHILCFSFFYNNGFAQFSPGEITLCKDESLPNDRYVVISNSRNRYGNCPLATVNGIRTITVKPIGTVTRITVCNHSPVPKGYRVESWGRQGQCQSLAINDQTVKVLVAEDADGDGYDYNRDCDDTNAQINPGRREIPFNNIDDDCNSKTHDKDGDQDGYVVSVDCNDRNPDIHPGATEIPYNGVDEDCDPTTRDDDLDGDGFKIGKDCNDRDATVNPNVTEIEYNGKDDDCNPITRDDDIDMDGYINAKDCNDNNKNIHPGARERTNNDNDDNCNGLWDEVDKDKDGFLTYKRCIGVDCPPKDCDDTKSAINPEAKDIINNGIDENCNGIDRQVIWQVAYGGTTSWNKLNKRSPLSSNRNQLLVGDFDGDGIDDLFRANGINWVLFKNGRDDIVTLNTNNPIKANKFKVGDFDGDGKADIFYATGEKWLVASGGQLPWTKLQDSDVPEEKIYIGDYDGDGTSDVAVISTQKIKISYKGTEKFIISELNTYNEFGFLIGDFDGDGKDDIFNANGKKWRLLSGGIGNWKGIRDQIRTTDLLQVGYFNQVAADGTPDQQADIFYSTGEDWRVWYGAEGVRQILKTSTEKKVRLGDFDGDGQTDVIRILLKGE